MPWAFDGAPAIIVGVVVDATIRALGEVPPAVIYEPAFRAEPGSYHLLVATNSGAVSERVIASAIEQLAPRLPILRLASLDDLVADSFATTRLTAFLAAAAGALALLLAVTGLYGVIACAVADREREFGLRFALGAVTADVLRLVAWNAARLAAIGIALGLLLSLAGLRLLSGLLFGVRPIETPTLAAIATLLLAIALATCAVPALRAAQVDPARALGS